jgi:hypothetical protein
LSLTEAGFMRLALKTPYRDGTTHVIFEPKDVNETAGGVTHGRQRRIVGLVILVRQSSGNIA